MRMRWRVSALTALRRREVERDRAEHRLAPSASGSATNERKPSSFATSCQSSSDGSANTSGTSIVRRSLAASPLGPAPSRTRIWPRKLGVALRPVVHRGEPHELGAPSMREHTRERGADQRAHPIERELIDLFRAVWR